MHRVKCCKLAAVAETDDGMDIFYDFAYSTKNFESVLSNVSRLKYNCLFNQAHRLKVLSYLLSTFQLFESLLHICIRIVN